MSAATAKRRYYCYKSDGHSEDRFSKIIGAPRQDLGYEYQRLIPLIDTFMDVCAEAFLLPKNQAKIEKFKKCR
jgi:hypothetical protein